MDIVGVVGSMRKNRHTNTLVHQVIEYIKEIDLSSRSEVIHLADMDIRPCKVVCSSYCTDHPHRCSIDDDVPEVLNRMIQADALILGTPLYFRGPPAQFQAFAERLISMFFFQETQGTTNAESPLLGKPCGLIGVAEYSNPQQILEYLHDLCATLGMRPVLTDKFPYLGVAGQGDVKNDMTFHPFQRAKDLAVAIVNTAEKRA